MSDNKDMTGVLFRNDRKQSDVQPDRKGSCVIGGKEYWLAGWIKKGKAGDFLSLAFTAKDAKTDAKPRTSNDAPDMEIPF